MHFMRSVVSRKRAAMMTVFFILCWCLRMLVKTSLLSLSSLLTEGNKDRERRTYHPYEYLYREWKKVIRLLLRKETGEEEEEEEVFCFFFFLSLLSFFHPQKKKKRDEKERERRRRISLDTSFLLFLQYRRRKQFSSSAASLSLVFTLSLLFTLSPSDTTKKRNHLSGGKKGKNRTQGIKERE